jgi:class 3 adenylate cyclase
MKRKIAAILAADVVGYSKLVAEDEEETLRRLASYREVVDDFIAKANGRIFNTAGDAVLAEFSSAVEAVRCAIDVQESLRTRNMAYPPSRQMSFRMGITIGDVVERDGDLLGDGVNIAARLEGLAAPGGICISRTVYEQVANKLSVQFADIGAQEVKNIPNPVHAYMVALRAEDLAADALLRKKKTGRPALLVPVLAVAAIVVAGGVGAALYSRATRAKAPAEVAATAPSPAMAPAPPAPAMAPAAVPAPSKAAPGAPAQKSAAVPAAPPPVPREEVLAPGNVPFIPDSLRAQIRDEYLPGGDIKALAITTGRFIGYVTGQPNEELAKSVALDTCQKRVEAAKVTTKCEIYAVGNKVVSLRAHPPMPPAPYVARDSLVERTFSVDEMPLVRDQAKDNLRRNYASARKSKAIALGPAGGYTFFTAHDTADEAVRRALEVCGSNAGSPCMIVALDDNFVVPVPKTMKATSFFRPTTNSFVAANEREFLARRYASASKGWNAVAASLNGKTGVALGAENEDAAVKAALADCAKVDRECRIIAIGPFSVDPL